MKRTVLVTGGNRGIGLAVVRKLAELGNSVFLGSRDLEAGEGAAAPLRQAGLDVSPVHLDLTAVAIDPSGKCRWDSNMVSTEHVIEVLTERVSMAYLKHLRDRQVSYVFAGKTAIDLKMALAKLARLFGIRKARVDGGGIVWGSFLKASLVDEISHIVVPNADGTRPG